MLATFSVKESIYKALDPFVRRYVGFTEVELDPLPADLTCPDRVVWVGAQMRLAEGEGPFEVQTTFCWRDDPVSTARVRQAH